MNNLSCNSENSETNKSKQGWQHCYHSNNNQHNNYPAIMNDGRLWSQWQPDAQVNERIQQKEGIQTNWNYRQYLQSNGEQIINYNTQEACYTLGLDPQVTTGKTPTNNVPYTFKGTFDSSIGNNTSDLKSYYLSREQLNARLIAPSIHLPQK
jgi:hypothetical protein